MATAEGDTAAAKHSVKSSQQTTSTIDNKVPSPDKLPEFDPFHDQELYRRNLEFRPASENMPKTIEAAKKMSAVTGAEREMAASTALQYPSSTNAKAGVSFMPTVENMPKTLEAAKRASAVTAAN